MQSRQAEIQFARQFNIAAPLQLLSQFQAVVIVAAGAFIQIDADVASDPAAVVAQR